MLLPLGVKHGDVSQLPIRAYVSIHDNFFRDQNNIVSPFQDYSSNSATQGVKASVGNPTINA